MNRSWMPKFDGHAYIYNKILYRFMKYIWTKSKLGLIL